VARLLQHRSLEQVNGLTAARDPSKGALRSDLAWRPGRSASKFLADEVIEWPPAHDCLGSWLCENARPSPPGLGRHAGARAAVFVVPKLWGYTLCRQQGAT
jgi:hypothetical protein